jgi:hypothetical protein
MVSEEVRQRFSLTAFGDKVGDSPSPSCDEGPVNLKRPEDPFKMRLGSHQSSTRTDSPSGFRMPEMILKRVVFSCTIRAGSPVMVPEDGQEHP